MKAITCINAGIYPVSISFIYNYSYDEVISFYKKHKAKDWYNGIESDKKLMDECKYLAMHRTIEYTSKKKQKKGFNVLYLYRGRV